MNYIDLLLFIILVWCIWVGVRRGFILSSLELFSWLGSLVIGFAGYKLLSIALLKIFPAIGFLAPALSFVIIIIVARVILDRLAGRILQLIPLRMHTGILNKVLGVLPGLVDGYIWAALLAAMLLLIPFTNPVSEQARGSKLAAGLVGKAGWLDNWLSPVFGEALSRVVHRPGAEGGEEKFIKLPFSVRHPQLRPDLEAEMLQLVNTERASRGISPLKADLELTMVARKHSADMLARGYFSHYTPEGIDPFARMKKDNLRFLAAGENVALTQTLFLAHYGLMHSPGHRANILNPAFGRLGIGIEDGGIHGLMITQDFRN
jgi:uncharacterized membrane protein required for colicin V production